ncbi:MAG TPA: hypothetical protein VHI52_00615, partial [Verrucomicrobiae bacterium]|nr:hypothetical protein [Verrucomicrobiae bacterium]
MSSEVNSNSQPGETGAGNFGQFLHSWRYFLWLLGIILLLGLVLGEENWRGNWAWTRYKKQMAAQGEPIELAAVVPPQVPDDQNFAMTPFLAPLFGFLPGPSRSGGQAAARSLNAFAAGYEAASRELNIPKTVPFSSWIKPAADLRDWYVAFKVSAEKAEKKQNPAVRTSGPAYRLQSGRQTSSGTEPVPALTNYTPTEAAKAVLDMLSDTRGIFDELRAASKLPHSRFNLNYEQDDP